MSKILEIIKHLPFILDLVGWIATLIEEIEKIVKQNPAPKPK